MMDLIDRLERAEGPSRELDEQIAHAVLRGGGTVRLLGMDDREPDVSVFVYPDGSTGTALRYTASLDAALTLVPEGAVWMVQTDYCGLNRAHINYRIPVRHPQIRPPENFDADAETPAIALCIAALKARLAANPTSATPPTPARQR